jgi:hypothetical protein
LGEQSGADRIVAVTGVLGAACGGMKTANGYGGYVQPMGLWGFSGVFETSFSIINEL